MAVKQMSWRERTPRDSLVSLNGNHSDREAAIAATPAAGIDAILDPVRPALALVEAKMKSVDSSLFTPLANAFVDLIGSGGKRLRPAVALLAAHLGEPGNGKPVTNDHVISLAASVEMLHTSTLVHDDVIDGALLRRGAPTLNAKWNRGATVLAGDFMFARAAYFAAETDNPRVIRIFSDTLDVIVNGELRQLWSRHHFQQDVAEYYERIEAKTASLFRAAAESAGVLTGLSDHDVRHLWSYGHNLGISFLIVDDMLDFTGNETSLGKPAGSDLLQGTLTLPFFHYLRTMPKAESFLGRLETAYEQADDDPQTWRWLVAQVAADVKTSSAIDAARADAVSYLERAKMELASFPHSVYRTSLLALCDFVVQRTY